MGRPDSAAAMLENDASLLVFAEDQLGLALYDWQGAAIAPFEHAQRRLVQVSLATPNGSGKSAVVIPALALGWLALHPRGRVVLTTADGKQLDGQVMPALVAYRARLPKPSPSPMARPTRPIARQAR